MLISEENILELLPQRSPMVMIDTLVSCDEKQVVSRFLIKENNIFLNENGFSASGIMENMAQTAAARTGWLMKNKTGGENKSVPVGVIGSIKNFKLHFQPRQGSLVETTITIEHEVMLATIVKGKAEVEGKLAAESEMQIFLTENQ
jgi:3-hydroxymyristoyl/3-hydroxydecanoyl-(acyl carrier protein) dehydratase